LLDLEGATANEHFDVILVSNRCYPAGSEMLENLAAGTPVLVMTDMRDRVDYEQFGIIELPVSSLNLSGALSRSRILRRLAEVPAEVPGTILRVPGASYRALVVDDLASSRKIAANVLAVYGIQTDAAASGWEALQKISATRYDIVFMDYVMPDMDGIATAKAVRRIEGNYFAKLPIIALTGYAVTGMQEKLLEGGMTDLLSKPIMVSELEKILQKYLFR
jgi:CheY-like chemotaxis protein